MKSSRPVKSRAPAAPRIVKPRDKVPALAGKGGSLPKFPWESLKVGDSFFIAGKTTKTVGSLRRAADVRLKITTTARNSIEGDVSGVTIRRVA